MEDNKKYKYWDILESLPIGWVVDKTAGSPAPNTVFITNGKSLLNGQKRALLRVEANKIAFETKNKTNEVVKKIEPSKQFPFPSKTVNTLARRKFQEILLKEVQFDLVVCEIEGWDKKEYIKELRKLLNGIIFKKSKNKDNPIVHPNLFDEI